MRKGREKAKQTAREREYEQNGLTADDVRQNPTNDCTDQPATKYQWRGKRGQHGFVTNQVKLKSKSNNKKTPSLLQTDQTKKQVRARRKQKDAIKYCGYIHNFLKIPFKPEFFFSGLSTFSGFNFTSAQVVCRTAMINHIFISFSAVQMYDLYIYTFHTFTCSKKTPLKLKLINETKMESKKAKMNRDNFLFLSQTLNAEPSRETYNLAGAIIIPTCTGYDFE